MRVLIAWLALLMLPLTGHIRKIYEIELRYPQSFLSHSVMENSFYVCKILKTVTD